MLQSLFPGGIRIPDHKAATADQPIRELPVPDRLYVPLKQHIGNPAQPVVEPGDTVLKGDVIGEPEGFVSVPVHAPTSGTVVAVADYPAPHPSGLAAPAVVIDADGRDQWTDLDPHPDYDQLGHQAVRSLIRRAGLVGLGGAGFPTFIKLNPGPEKPIDTVILNGGESEPYLTCDDRLMRESADGILRGAAILAYVVGARQIRVAIEANKPEALAAMEAAAGDSPQIEIIPVDDLYPMGAERQLITTLTGREVPSGRLPADVGVLCQNMGTAHAAYRAVVHGEPVIDRVLTASGAGLAEPANLRVRIGTPLYEIAEACGGYPGRPGRMILGGPMVGSPLHSDAPPVVKETNGFIVQSEGELARDEALPCIRCGACVDACPEHLMPNDMYAMARNRELDKVQEYDLFDCIECGSCAYVCPSNLPLVQYYRFAKGEIQKREREKEQAEIARRRSEAREARLAREKAEKEAKRKKKKKEASGNKQERAEAARQAAENKAGAQAEGGEDPSAADTDTSEQEES
jgi:electron transport complex protein RnfC